jgi:hypothetical protein
MELTYKTAWGETYRWTLPDKSDESMSRLLTSMLNAALNPNLAFDVVDFDLAVRQFFRERLLSKMTPQARASVHLFGFFTSNIPDSK